MQKLWRIGIDVRVNPAIDSMLLIGRNMILRDGKLMLEIRLRTTVLSSSSTLRNIITSYYLECLPDFDEGKSIMDFLIVLCKI